VGEILAGHSVSGGCLGDLFASYYGEVSHPTWLGEPLYRDALIHAANLPGGELRPIKAKAPRKPRAPRSMPPRISAPEPARPAAARRALTRAEVAELFPRMGGTLNRWYAPLEEHEKL
jgi:hypothetical protein